jgi:hypothetical protein
MKTGVVLRGSSGIYWPIRTLSPNATGLERGCVQSTSRSTLKSPAASGVFQQAVIAKLLRLVFDTAALRGGGKMHLEPTGDS